MRQIIVNKCLACGTLVVTDGDGCSCSCGGGPLEPQGEAVLKLRSQSNTIKKEVKIFYECNKLNPKCKHCGESPCGHTSDIRYAKNFICDEHNYCKVSHAVGDAIIKAEHDSNNA